MNLKRMGIGAAAALCLTTWISRVTGLVTDDQLLYVFWALVIVAGSMIVSYGISWTATDGYKRYHWAPDRWKDQKVKKRIFKCAWWSGGVSMFACGCFALLLTTTGMRLAIFSFGWLILCFFVAFTSPWLWAFTNDNFLPRLKRMVRGKRQDENEAEAEALMRPTDKPEK